MIKEFIIPNSCSECKYFCEYERLSDYFLCKHLLFGCYFSKNKYDIKKEKMSGCLLGIKMNGEVVK